MKEPKAILFSVIALTLLWNSAPSYGLRILGIFPMGSRSHFSMSERMLRTLAERGHQVDVYSHFPLKTPRPNYTDYSLEGVVHVNNMPYQVVKLLSNEELIKIMMQQTNAAGDMLGLPIFQNLIKNPPKYDVFITEPFVMNYYFAFGRHLNIPMINMVPLPSLMDWLHEPLGSPRNYAAESSTLLQLPNPTSFLGRLENLIRSNKLTYTFNSYVREQDAIIKKYFGPDFPNAVDIEKDISLVLLNYSPSFSEIRTYSPNIIPVAGIHIEDSADDLPKDVQKFVDEAKDGFVYFTLGSMIQFETYPREVIKAFYNTFEKMAPVRFLMKIAKPELLPPGLPSNVITHHWLPQVNVLKHKNIKAFITHGGLMGTQESIYHGVPMIGIPMFADQYYNIDFYAKRNLAIKLEEADMTEESLTKAVKEILTNPLYKKSAEDAGNKMRDVPMTPVDTAIFWVEYIARHGKDALRPPVVDLPWWQASLLDVYAFIISIVLVVLYIIKIVLKKIVFMFSLKIKTGASSKKLKVN